MGVKIMFNNIEGLKSKMFKGEINELTQKFDIIGMGETWYKEDKIEIKGFKGIIKNRVKTKKSGRQPGGIMILIREEISKNVTEIKSESEEIIWIVISEVGTDSISLIGCVYHHPINSQFYENDFFRIVAREIDEITVKYGIKVVLVMGDFNARIGEEEVGHAELNDENNVSKERSIRVSKDKIRNSEGVKLLDLCLENDLEILNGNGEEGNYTYVSNLGRSVIDYMLITRSAVEAVNYFSIENRTSSYHMCLELSIEGEYLGIRGEGRERRIKTNSKGRKAKGLKIMKWDERYASDFKMKIGNKQGVETIIEAEDLIGLNMNEEALDRMQKHIERAGIKMRKGVYKKVEKVNDRWFDEECRVKKQMVRKGYKEWKRENSEISLEKFLKGKQEYKELLGRKKYDYHSIEAEKINELIVKGEIGEVWRGIKRIKGSQISVDEFDEAEWAEYYKKLFAEDKLVSINMLELGYNNRYLKELDGDFTKEEMNSMLSKLKKIKNRQESTEHKSDSGKR